MQQTTGERAVTWPREEVEEHGKRTEPPRFVDYLNVGGEGREEHRVVPTLGPEQLEVRAAIHRDVQGRTEQTWEWKFSPQCWTS